MTALDINTEQQQRTIFASSFAQRLMQSPSFEWELDYQQDQYLTMLTRQSIAELMAEALLDANTEVQWMKAMRLLRSRLMLRWIWQDANQLISVTELTKQLSDFADLSIEAAVKFSRPALVEKYGEPIGYTTGEVQQLIVIAMGKLGAQELNLSSDIDLIFAFDEMGESNGKRCIDTQQFCNHWGKQVIYLLDQITADGFVFRVDMRLRPWGDGSALTLSQAALEKYLLKHGREWERYAWIKARIVTGGQHGQDLLKMTRPFVFRRYVDFSAFNAMREMKGMIQRAVDRKQSFDDIKLGAGGIREIEFITQVFQLIYGGSRVELQQPQCVAVLKKLVDFDLLEQEVVNKLIEAYYFLRRTEHAIQAQEDQQTQILPQEESMQHRLAVTLGFSDWAAFYQQLEQHRQQVSFYFDQIINDHESQHTENTAHREQLEELLDDNARNLVAQFWKSSQVENLTGTVRERLDLFWEKLKPNIINASRPQKAIVRMIPLIESVLRRSVYLVMLTENPVALKRLITMVIASPWISEELTRYPVLLDEFLSTTFELPEREELHDFLRQQLLRVEIDDIESQMRVLRLFNKSQVLSVAASDILAERPLMKVSDALSDIAEVTINATLNLAFKAMIKRYGYPKRHDGSIIDDQNSAFIVVGYGKLGGLELGYGSDLDLVFIHQFDEQADTDGKKAISGMEFATRVAQRFVSLLTTQTLDGRAYEVDTRLRPSGDAGVLVTSLNAFQQYQQQHAWLWEHQALVRARSIAGDQQLAAYFEQIRLKVLVQQRNEQTVREEVIQMRQKMLGHLGSSKNDQKNGIFHLKHDAGGIVDIEFMAQYSVLVWSSADPSLARYSDNIRIFESAAQAGHLSNDDANALIQAYLTERGVSHRLALAHKRLTVNANEWQQTRDCVNTLWQRLINPSRPNVINEE